MEAYKEKTSDTARGWHLPAIQIINLMATKLSAAMMALGLALFRTVWVSKTVFYT